jgi:hypothetical protein
MRLPTAAEDLPAPIGDESDETGAEFFRGVLYAAFLTGVLWIAVALLVTALSGP